MLQGGHDREFTMDIGLSLFDVMLYAVCWMFHEAPWPSSTWCLPYVSKA